MNNQHSEPKPPASIARWRLHSRAIVLASGVLTAFWLAGSVIVWFVIAGDAGSPEPDNWQTMLRILDIVETGMFACLVMLILTPFACIAARQGKRWPGILPVLLIVLGTAQLWMCKRELAIERPPHIAHLPHQPGLA